MYKRLFQQILSLLTSPGKAWDDIVDRGGTPDILSGFVYPLIGLCGLSGFVGAFIEKGFSSVVFQLALMRCCAVAVALFGGYFLSVYVLDKIGVWWFKEGNLRGRMSVFVGYSMSVPFALNILSGIVPVLLLYLVLQIYTLVVVFEGVRRWLEVPERGQMLFTFVSTLVILACPALIGYVFTQLSVNLN